MELRQKKLNIYVSSVIFISVFAFCFLYFTGQVKAEAVIEKLVRSGDNYAIPDYDGDAVVFCPMSAQFLYNGVASTQLIGSDGQFSSPLYYHLNPEKDSVAHIGGGSITWMSYCILASNLDSQIPFEYVGYQDIYTDYSTINDILLADYNIDTVLISNIRRYKSDEDYTDLTGFDLVHEQILNVWGSYYISNVYKHNGISESPFSLQVFSGYTHTRASFFQINFNSVSSTPVPTSQNSVEWQGFGETYIGQDRQWDLTMNYNFCDIYNNNISRAYITYCDGEVSDQGECDDALFPYIELIGSNAVFPYQCSKTQTFTPDVNWQLINNYSTSSPMFMTPILVVDYNDDSYDVIYGEPFSYVMELGDIGELQTNFVHTDQDALVNVEVGEDLLVAISYDLTDYNFATSTSQFCLYNEESNNIISSMCSSLNETTAVNGTSSLLLKGSSVPFDQPFSVAYLENGILQLKSILFTVYWGQGRPNDLITSPIDYGDDGIMYSWWRKLLNVFPFNFVFLFQDAWELSESELLTEDLQFLDMADENGNLTASFPKEWLGSDVDKQITIFGEDYIANGSQSAKDLFANFRLFSKWLQYTIFVFGLYALAIKLVNELTANKNDDL